MNPVTDPRKMPETQRLPRHVGIIMDGNGRWAASRSLPRVEGHRRGVEAVRRTVRAAGDLGIEFLTLYSFSIENWSRPPNEVSDLIGLLKGKDVMVGVIDVANPAIETPEEIADTIGRALQFVPRQHLIACTNCGLAPMSREVAEAKLKALAEGAKLAARRYG